MSDRALQDRVIRYLTDANERTGVPPPLPLTGAEAARAGRFANFLARHYYRDRLARSFQYSYVFREHTGRTAEQVADSPEFNTFLTGCVLGSLASAQQIGDTARNYMLAGPHPAPWWSSLVEYEYAYFLQAATSELTPKSQVASRGRSALLKRFEWFMPELLSRVRNVPLIANAATTGAPSRAPRSSTDEPVSTARPLVDETDLRRAVTLLFSRTREGKLFVVEVEQSVAAVFEAADGFRDIDEISASAGVPPEEARETIAALTTIGAIVHSG